MANKIALFFVTHLDDDTLSFGGLMSRMKDAGVEMHVHVFCCGGPCSNAPREVRIAEAMKVADYFGAHYTFEDRELDGLLDQIPSCELTGIMDRMIEDIKPNYVYCTALSEHSDHIALHKAFMGACRIKSGHQAELYAVGRYPFSDQLYANPEGGKLFQPLTEKDMECKRVAMSFYKSQLKPAPSPLSMQGVESQAIYDGMMCGHKYAEQYYQVRYTNRI